MTNWDFEGRTAIVTGGSRGIGLAVAQVLARSGAAVVITARKEAELDEALQQIDGRASYVVGSVTDTDHMNATVAAALERYGSLDILVNNAATNPQYGPLHKAEMSAVDKTWDTNLRAPLVWTQAVWKAYMAENGGGILMVSSSGGIRVGPMLGAYNVAKAALIQMTKQLALEMAPGVRVNAVAPAVVKTRFSQVLYEGPADPTPLYPLKRLGEGEDVAEAAAFLLSDSSSWITGETILLDGGVSLVHPQRGSR